MEIRCYYCNTERNNYNDKDDVVCNYCSKYICNDCLKNDNLCFIAECGNCKKKYCFDDYYCDCETQCMICLEKLKFQSAIFLCEDFECNAGYCEECAENISVNDDVFYCPNHRR